MQDSIDIFFEAPIGVFGGLSKWVNSPIGNIFLRRTRRYFNKKWYRTIEVASISIYEEHQRKGNLKNIINILNQKAIETNSLLLFENVLNNDLRNYLLSIGYYDVQNYMISLIVPMDKALIEGKKKCPTEKEKSN